MTGEYPAGFVIGPKGRFHKAKRLKELRPGARENPGSAKTKKAQAMLELQ
jgi:hypothetical protein